jgi:hypothetical protein
MEAIAQFTLAMIRNISGKSDETALLINHFILAVI